MIAPTDSVAPRRFVILTLARSLLASGILVLAYYQIPLRGTDAPVALGLVLSLIAFASLVIWQIQSIVESTYPGLRAVEAVATVIPLFLLVFAACYYRLSENPGVFTEPMNKTDAIYFTVTVFATVGFGDITPVDQTARVLVTVQMLGNLVVIGAVVRGMLNAVSIGRQRQSARTDPARGPDSPPDHSARP